MLLWIKVIDQWITLKSERKRERARARARARERERERHTHTHRGGDGESSDVFNPSRGTTGFVRFSALLPPLTSNCLTSRARSSSFYCSFSSAFSHAHGRARGGRHATCIIRPSSVFTTTTHNTGPSQYKSNVPHYRLPAPTHALPV